MFPMNCELEIESCLSESERQLLKTIREGTTIRLSADAFDRATSGEPSDMSDTEITFTEFVDENWEMARERFYEEHPEWAKTVALHKFFSKWAEVAKEGAGHFRLPVEMQWVGDDGSIVKSAQGCITGFRLGDKINVEVVNV